MTEDDEARDALVMERTFDAPVELIWQMWTDPAHFAEWYGPEGASIPAATLDNRVGGTRRVCMEVQTPGGAARMWFTGEYSEVVEHERLVYTESMSDENGNVLPPSAIGMPDGHPATTEVRLRLEDLGGRTKMVMTHIGVSNDSPGAAGWAMALDKLDSCVRARAGQ